MALVAAGSSQRIGPTCPVPGGEGESGRGVGVGTEVVVRLRLRLRLRWWWWWWLVVVSDERSVVSDWPLPTNH